MDKTPNLKIWPLITCAAIKRGMGCSVRLLWFGKHLDRKNGSGWVEKKALIAYLTDMGMNADTVRNWIRQAIKDGLARESDDGKLHMDGVKTLARKFGVLDPGYAIFVPEKKLLRRKWKETVYGAYLRMIGTTPRSQRVKKAQTGFSARSQVNYEKGLGVKVIKNVAIIGKGGKIVAEGLTEVSGGGYYFSSKGVVYQRLPNSTIVPADAAVKACKGQRKSIKLHVGELLSQLRQDQTTEMEHVRIFHGSSQAMRSAIRKYSKKDMPIYNTEFYAKSHMENGVQIWFRAAQ